MTSELQKPSTLRLILFFCTTLSRTKPTTYSTIVVALCWLRATGGTKFVGKRPTHLGVHSGRLTPCPGTPNCVNSQSEDGLHQIQPLTYSSTPTQAMTELQALIQSLERTKIITETQNYLYVEFTSSFWGFVDDVEFLLDENAQVIHVRSASRLGTSDLGVNRKRIEMIRSKFSRSGIKSRRQKSE